MIKNKELALNLLKQKINGEIKITYNEISYKSGYSRMQLSRLSKEIEKKDIDSILQHGNKGRKPSITASPQEVNYIRELKKKYPNISISQFQDIYNEDVIFNPSMINDVLEFNLKKRSESFFQQLFKKEGWNSPIKHRKFKGKDIHPLRDPSPRTGMLIMTDGTPHDWFGNGHKFSLHMTLDDATGEIKSGWFTPNECMLGYCYAFKIMIEKYGIPDSLYSDKTTILWDPKEGSLTQVGRMLDDIGINLIYANSPEAKGKIEKMNFTIQNRLLNDIKRFNITTYEQLNTWFNDFYIDYINKKFSYPPKEEESEFIPLGKTDLSTIFCIKDTRTILNGNMISIGNCYYIPINKDGTIHVFYKGTLVEVWRDVFNNKVRIKKDNIIYETKIVEGQRVDMNKKIQKKINNQKELEQALKERDERLKARATK